MVKETAGDFQPSFHASGEVLYEIIPSVPEVDEAQQVLDALLHQVPRHFVEGAVELEILLRRELVVQTGVLEYYPEDIAHFVCLLDSVDTVKSYPPAVGRRRVVNILIVVVLPPHLGPGRRRPRPFESKVMWLTATSGGTLGTGP